MVARLLFPETGPRADSRLEFLFAGEVEFDEPLDGFEARLLALAFGVRVGFVLGRGRVVSRGVLVLAPVLPPGTVNTTSSRLARCSTCAVAPG